MWMSEDELISFLKPLITWWLPIVYNGNVIASHSRSGFSSWLSDDVWLEPEVISVVTPCICLITGIVTWFHLWLAHSILRSFRL